MTGRRPLSVKFWVGRVDLRGRPVARRAGVLIGVHDGSTGAAAAYICGCGAVHDGAMFVCANQACSAFRVDGKT